MSKLYAFKVEILENARSYPFSQIHSHILVLVDPMGGSWHGRYLAYPETDTSNPDYTTIFKPTLSLPLLLLSTSSPRDNCGHWEAHMII